MGEQKGDFAALFHLQFQNVFTNPNGFAGSSL